MNRTRRTLPSDQINSTAKAKKQDGMITRAMSAQGQWIVSRIKDEGCDRGIHLIATAEIQNLNAHRHKESEDE